ncbi:MAG: hypothetical protein QM706_09530 [Nitrospira sp.]
MKQTTIALSAWDRAQALNHSPEYQHCLRAWRKIEDKDLAGELLTKEEGTIETKPRSGFNLMAEFEVTHKLHSKLVRDLSTMSEDELAWRDMMPQLDYPNKVAVVHIPLEWTLAAIEKTVGRIVRVYKNRIGLSDAKYNGQSLHVNDCSPTLRQTELTLRLPLKCPVEMIDKVMRHVVRVYRKKLGITSSQCLRRPEDVDPWLVYRLHLNEKLSLLEITHRLYGTSGSPSYDSKLNKLYARVKRAYLFAKKAIEQIGQLYS